VLLLRSTTLALKAHKTLGDVLTVHECEDVASLNLLNSEAIERGWERPREYGWTIDPCEPYPDADDTLTD
jgi:hypothetical protein